jgi:hypothetical protein
MYFIEDPRPYDEIVVEDPINPKALSNACNEFLYGFYETLGDFTEEHALSMISLIYRYPITYQKFFLPDEEIAEKKLEDAKVSLLNKTKKVTDQERLRRRIVRFLSIIENRKYEKHKRILSEIMSTIDAEFDP